MRKLTFAKRMDFCAGKAEPYVAENGRFCSGSLFVIASPFFSKNRLRRVRNACPDRCKFPFKKFKEKGTGL
jgi:hypothetical protein